MPRTYVRWVRVLTVILAVWAAVTILGIAGGVRSAAGSRPVAQRVYTVRRGDTLWAIASRLAGPRGDPRPVVDALVSRNHLPGAVIVPGQRLVLDP